MDPYKLHHQLEDLYVEVEGRDVTEYRTGYLDAIQFIIEIVEEELDD
jgi:hypothetical protein